MQTATVSRFWLCGRSWRFKIHFWRNVVRFWKSYVCSNKLDVQETNCCFSQLNRIWNHLSLDTGLRSDGLPALELWDLIVSVLGNVSRVSDRSWKLESDDYKHHKSHNKIDVTRDIDAVPSIVQSARQEASLVVRVWRQWSCNQDGGRSLTMRHVSRTHRVALDWLFDRINLNPKIQIKYIDTKNQLADILTKGNFTRDEWNHVLNLLNISHFSSTACTAAMAKRAQQGSGEELVTAKSRPMMTLTERTPSAVSSSASSNPVRTSFGYQDPGRSVASDDRTRKQFVTTRLYTRGLWSILVFSRVEKMELRSTIDRRNLRQLLEIYCKKLTLIVKNLFSAEMRILQGTEIWFTIERGNPCQRITKERQIPKISSWAVTQQNLWTESKTKSETDKRMSNVAESGDEHSIIWGMFMATTLNAATFMGNNFSTIQSVKNHESLTLKQMFDVAAQLVNNQEEINCLDKILWEKNSWTRLSLIDDEIVINLQSTKVYVFSDSMLCLGKVLQHPEFNEAWKNRVAGARFEKSYRDYVAINGESTEFEWNIFPGFTTLQLCDKINDLLSSMG